MTSTPSILEKGIIITSSLIIILSPIVLITFTLLELLEIGIIVTGGVIICLWMLPVLMAFTDPEERQRWSVSADSETKVIEVNVAIDPMILIHIVPSALRELGVYSCSVCKLPIGEHEEVLVCPRCSHGAHRTHLLE